MSDQPLTLSDLAEHSGVEVRTLRSWMQQGVIPGPETVGRNARYAASTLTRVLAVKAMREVYGLSLAEIRRDLVAADESRIAAYAALASGDVRSKSSAGEDAGQVKSPAPPDPAPPPAASSAADYLRGLRSAGVFGGASKDPGPPSQPRMPVASPSLPSAGPRARHSLTMSFDPRDAAGPSPSPPRSAADAPERLPAPAGGGSRLARLAEALERVAGARPTRRKARGEVRLHIPITPDLELAVRGDHSPEEIARFEQVADLLRTILTGGSEND
jgi:DNA-binding transcriptional MerR regulator